MSYENQLLLVFIAVPWKRFWYQRWTGLSSNYYSII